MEPAHPFRFKIQSGPTRVAVALGAAVVYALAFVLLYPRVGAGTATLSALPAGMAGWLLGLGGGLLAGLLAIPLNILLFNRVGVPGAQVILQQWPGVLVALGTGLAMGWVSDLYHRLRREAGKRRQADARLQEAEAKYRALVEHIPIVSYIDALDDAGSTLYISPQVTAWFGYSVDEWLADPEFWVKLLHPDDRACALAENARHNTTGEPFKLEYRLLARDGRVVWVRDEAVVVRNEAGQPLFSQGVLLDITERKRAEVALEESEKRFRALIENSTDAVSLIGPDGAILYTSPVTTRILGYEADEIVGRNIFELLHPDDVQGVTSLFAQLLQNPGAVVTAQVRYRHKSGAWGWYEGTGHNLLAEPSVQAIVVNYRDIADRKQAEDKLQEAEAKYRTLVERLPAITYIAALDDAKTRLYVSPQIESLLGYSPAEWIADPDLWRNQLHPDDRQRVLAEASDLYAGRGSFVSEYRTLARDGRAVWFRDEAVLVRDASGRPQFLHGVKLDISERMQHERELEAIVTVAKALRAAPTRAEMLPIILDQVLDLLKAEGAALDIRDAVTGQTVMELGRGAWVNVTGMRTPPGEGLSSHVMTTGQPYVNANMRGDMQVAHPALPGDLPSLACVPLIAHGQPLGALWAGGHRPFTEDELRLLTAVGDIAANAIRRATVMETLEQRVAERTHELAEANELLKELDRLKDRFVANVSHELRTPLTNITLYLGLLSKVGVEELDRSLPVLKRETARLARLIENLLSLLRMAEGRVAFMPEPRVLDGLIAEVLEAHAARAEAKRLTLIHVPDPDAPAVPVDYGQMMQVLTNLVGNAVAYTPTQGQVMLTTNPAEFSGQGGVAVRVHNTSPVIPPEDLPHVFERFYRGQAGRESGEPGTGLGLAICKEIMDRHGGRITVRSAEGFGTEFATWLPAAEG